MSDVHDCTGIVEPGCEGCAELPECAADKELIEKLAALEHEQWHQWTKSLYTHHRKEISYELMNKWVQNWAPYHMLSEDEKEKDRKWARKALEIIKASR